MTMQCLSNFTEPGIFILKFEGETKKFYLEEHLGGGRKNTKNFKLISVKIQRYPVPVISLLTTYRIEFYLLSAVREC